jgi:hypothetical protein
MTVTSRPKLGLRKFLIGTQKLVRNNVCLKGRKNIPESTLEPFLFCLGERSPYSDQSPCPIDQSQGFQKTLVINHNPLNDHQSLLVRYWSVFRTFR